jgi:hypothetical protein
VSSLNSFATPTGSVTFTFYSGGNCATGTAAGAGTVDLDAGGVAHPSDASGALGAGSYAYQAHYNGDPNFNESTSDCEPFTIDKAGSSTLTEIHNAAEQAVTSVALGSTVHDKATVTSTNTSFSPTGNVSFTFWRTAKDCQAGTSETAGTVDLDASGVAHPSSSKGPLAAGDYAFRASYAGDGNFNGSTSPCEPLTVNKAQLTMDSQVHDANHVDKTNGSVVAGSVMHDTGKITGGVVSGFSTAPITFKFYANGTCSGDGTAVNNIGQDQGDSTRDRSANSAPLAAGPYSYKAFVAGNSNYIGADSGCEPFTVVPPTAKITPTQTTCEQFRSGTNGDLTDEFYTSKANKIVSVSPGVFFYYSQITAPSSSFTIEVKQTIPAGWPAIGTMQLILWDANCVKTAVTGTSSNGTVTFNATGLTAGATYYVSIKYDPTTLVGQNVAGKPTVVYAFRTYINGTFVFTSLDSLNIRPK